MQSFLEMHVNSMKSFERINEAVTSDKETILLEVLSEDGGTRTINIPGFGYMKRELERLDRNLKALSGLGDGTAKVKLADGTYQRLITSTLKTPANDLTSVKRPSKFSAKSNYFFEDFLTPLLTVRFDVSGQIPSDTERVLVKRYIFDSSFAFAAEFFDENYKDTDGISHAALIADLASNNIPYFEDEETRDLPYRSTQFYGSFDVTSIDNAQRQVVVDGNPVTKNIKLYTLDKLTYTDGDKELNETEFLKVGDELIVNSNSKSTKYRVKNIVTSTRQVELDLIEGYEAIKIGADVLKIYKANGSQVDIEINVGFNERIVVFFKPIDPYSKILAENWSPGAAIYSNELTVDQEDGSQKSLADYYVEEVADFGQFIRALKEDAIPPSTLGVAPDAPLMFEENFKVVQINKHLTENDATTKIKKLNADKVAVDEAIKKLDDTITKKRETIATKKYKSKIEKDSDRNELNALSTQRESESSLYNSIVNQIQAIASDSQVTNIQPKFRIRGFWPIPEPKIVAETVPQNVVQFVIQYRYLSTSGKTSEISQIAFTDGNQSTTGVFSNWTEIKSGIRTRVKDETSGKFVWSTTAIEDGQEVNFNQLDIPIQKGEIVEIRIKSVSEAGWPSNPITGDWSDIIRINFPEGELDTADITNLVEKNATETAKVSIIQELEARGLYRHLGDSFVSNEKYYSHSATSINSGFLSPEQTPISLFDKLNDLELKIRSLEEALSNAKGEISVKVVKEDGTIVNINKNTSNKVFAGYYTDEVAELTVKKGHIVTKTFKVLIENSNSTTLELIARVLGDRKLPVYKSSIASDDYGIDPAGTNIPTQVLDDNYYRTEAKYDRVAIQYQNITDAELQEVYTTSNGTALTFNHNTPYQSAQRRGQFVYSRFMNVANESALYLTDTSNVTSATSGIAQYEHNISYNSVFDGNGSVSDYIWNGTFRASELISLVSTGIANDITEDILNQALELFNDNFDNSFINTVTLNGVTNALYDNGILLHKDHPDLSGLWNGYSQSIYNAFSAIDDLTGFTGLDLISTFTDASNTFIQGLIDSGIYTMPVTSTLRSEQAYGKTQLPYIRYNSEDLPNRSAKMSFDSNDQYLLGGKSCGSFLFIAPINSESFLVDGDNKFGKKRIENGEANAVSIDLVFQYRMTDFSGTSENSDLGKIGGITSTNLSNLTYAKKIGIDIFDSENDQYSFDVEVFAKYKAEGSNQNSITAAQLVV